MTESSPTTVPPLEIKRLIPAAPDQVFRALHEPTYMKRWFVPTSVRLVDIEVDFRLGGAYRIHFSSEQTPEFSVGGTFIAIEPPHRLVYS